MRRFCGRWLIVTKRAVHEEAEHLYESYAVDDTRKTIPGLRFGERFMELNDVNTQFADTTSAMTAAALLDQGMDGFDIYGNAELDWTKLPRYCHPTPVSTSNDDRRIALIFRSRAQQDDWIERGRRGLVRK